MTARKQNKEKEWPLETAGGRFYLALLAEHDPFTAHGQRTIAVVCETASDGVVHIGLMNHKTNWFAVQVLFRRRFVRRDRHKTELEARDSLKAHLPECCGWIHAARIVLRTG